MATKAKAVSQNEAVIQALQGLTNTELVNALRAEDPNFANMTAEATAMTFTERGYSQLAAGSLEKLNTMYNLLIRIVFQQLNISDARDPLADADIGESYDTPQGGITQRIATETIKPCDPAYLKVVNGASIDPFIVSLPEQSERFFERNFDYQSMVTLQNYPLKQIFLRDQGGMSQFISGVMRGLLNGWTIQKYNNKLEVLNAGINDPLLRPTQVIEVDLPEDFLTATDVQMQNFMQQMMDLIDDMTEESPQTAAFNSAKHATVQDRSRLRLLMRHGFTSALKVKTRLGAFNPEELNLGLSRPIKTMRDFGGITYQLADGTPLYIARDSIGRATGLTDVAGTDKKYDFDSTQVVAVDPNSDVVGILMDKGWLFEEWQNGYIVDPIHNPRGMYDNYFANAPSNAIHYDNVYNFVVIKRKATPAPTPDPGDTT